MIDGLAITVLCVLAACSYGIIHDQITARVCIEYFTIGHPQILKMPTASPTLLGLVWGIIATWWVGFGLGIPLAIAARFGSRPKKAARDVVIPLLMLLAVAAALAAIAGVIGYLMATAGWIQLYGSLAARVPADKHSAFIADLFAHNVSYLVGAVGGVALIVSTWRSRQRPKPSLT